MRCSKVKCCGFLFLDIFRPHQIRSDHTRSVELQNCFLLDFCNSSFGISLLVWAFVTNFVERSPFWKGDSSSANLETPRIWWDLKVCLHFHRIRPFSPVVSQMIQDTPCHSYLDSWINVITVMTSRRMRWAGHVGRMGETRNWRRSCLYSWMEESRWRDLEIEIGGKY